MYARHDLPSDPVTGKAIIGNEDLQFNAANYVAQLWDEQVIPVLHEQANDIMTVLAALRADETGAAEQNAVATRAASRTASW